MWHRPIACLPVLCVQNASELKQHLLDVSFSMEQSITDRQLTMADESTSLFATKRRNFEQML